MSPIETLSQQITAKSNAGYHEIARKIKDAAELDAVRREWEQMAATSATIAAGFDYQRAWADGLASRQQLHVFLAAGGIAPLVRARGFAQPLTLLAAEMYEPLDFLYRTPQAVEELLMLIRRTALPLYLQRIPAASPIVTFVEKIFERRALIVRKPAAASPLIRLDESWIEPESHLNSGRRSDLRRARRTSEKLGAVETQILAPAPAEVAGLIGEVLRVEAAGWKGAAGTALAADPVRCEFFHRYCAAEARLGRLRICLLRIAGQNAAAQIAIQTPTRFSLLRAGYDEAFARSSPGNLLTRESIRHAALAGIATYEFNGDIEPWTRLWTEEELACCSLHVFPFSLTGMTALAVRAAKSFLQRHKKHD